VRLRCPIVPGVNLAPDHEAALAAFADEAAEGHLETVERLPATIPAMPNMPVWAGVQWSADDAVLLTDP